MRGPRVVGVLLVSSAVVGGGACGGSEEPPASPNPNAIQAPFVDDRAGLVRPTPARDDANRSPRSRSVEHNAPPPPIAPAVEAAARAVGCTVSAHRSEANAERHTDREATAAVSIPPLSGAHHGRWADWGVYDRPVPFKYQLHNLEHGGVFVHYGREVPVAEVNAIRQWWARSPGYVLVAPDTAPAFPVDAVVAGSHQRWIVCRPFTASQITAIDAFVTEYRGRGPETQDAGNERRQGRQDDEPAPVIPDAGA